MIRLLALLTALLFALPALGEREIVSSECWEPPQLAEADASTPELLLLSIAQEELGYTEGPLSDQSKYGAWMGDERAPWCAEFITWCVDQTDQRYGTNLLNDLYPYYSGPSTGTPFFIYRGRFVSDTGRLVTRELQWFADTGEYVGQHEYIPYPGDYIWFCYYTRGQTDHVALVEGVSRDADGTIIIHVIEGNNPDRVQRAVYPIDYYAIYGFGTPVQRVHTNMGIYDASEDVQVLKSKLAALGYYEMEASDEDVFTRNVQKAVKQLQRDLQLTVTGVVGSETYMAIDALLDEREAEQP